MPVFKDALQKLDNIAALPGKNDKRDLLKAYLSNKVFARILTLMLSEDKTFHIKKLPLSNMPPEAGDANQIFNYLEQLAGQRGATNEDKNKLSRLVGNSDTREVVERILAGKTRAGFSATSVNKVVPGTVFKTPYQRCSGIEKADRVSYPATCQRKADGIFTYASPGFSRALLSRRGKSYDLLGKLEEEISTICKSLNGNYPNPVLCGELTLREPDGTTMSRKKGNGIINKFIKGTGTEEDANKVHLSVWDVLPMKDFRAALCEIPYGDRWSDLQGAIKNPVGQVSLIEAEEVENLLQAEEFYGKMRARGEEGAVLKDYSTIWKSNTAPTFVKMKNFVEAEFRVTAVNEGKDDFEGLVGSLTVQTEDGLIVSNVSSGLKLHERDIPYWESHIGDIITVKFESVITDKNRPDVKSLFIPVFIESRFEEKVKADTAKYVEAL
jgi:hypothetical protein